MELYMIVYAMLMFSISCSIMNLVWGDSPWTWVINLIYIPTTVMILLLGWESRMTITPKVLYAATFFTGLQFLVVLRRIFEIVKNPIKEKEKPNRNVPNRKLTLDDKEDLEFTINNYHLRNHEEFKKIYKELELQSSRVSDLYKEIHIKSQISNEPKESNTCSSSK